jgi:hypothetical protein
MGQYCLIQLTIKKIQVYRLVYFIMFFGLHPCLVKLPELESINPKAKGAFAVAA